MSRYREQAIYLFLYIHTLISREVIIMRHTGIVRNLDNLGRIVIPKEMRRVLGIEEKDPIEILIQDDAIMLRKYEPADLFTGEKEDLIDYCGKKISKKSITEMAQIAGIID